MLLQFVMLGIGDSISQPHSAASVLMFSSFLVPPSPQFSFSSTFPPSLLAGMVV
jgi:hypothetical protein